MKNILLLALVFSVAMSGSSYAAEKEMSDRMVVAGMEPLTTAQMSVIRGGFADPTGLIYSFAVNVRTDVAGQEVFSRSLTLMAQNGFVPALAQQSLPQNLPSGVSMQVIGNGTGIKLTSAAGQSLLMNQTASGVPSSIVINSANNSVLNQTVSLNLVMPSASVIAGYVRAATVGAALAQHNAIRSMGF